jgi:hypothetical protein
VIVLVARARYHWRAYLSRPERDEAHRRLAEGRRPLADEVAQAACYAASSSRAASHTFSSAT